MTCRAAVWGRRWLLLRIHAGVSRHPCRDRGLIAAPGPPLASLCSAWGRGQDAHAGPLREVRQDLRDQPGQQRRARYTKKKLIHIFLLPWTLWFRDYPGTLW